MYGVCITLMHRDVPVLGVIYDSHLERCYVARRGAGATCDGSPLAVSAGRGGVLRKLTIGWIQGHHVQKDPVAMKLKQSLDEHCKRVLRLWAPSLLWCMLARGDLDGIVLYNSEGDDLYAGVLMAMEAGALVIGFDGQPFAGALSEPYLIACHPDLKDQFLRLVHDTLDM